MKLDHIILLDEGTWALPNDYERATALYKLMQKPLAAKDAEKYLYNILGDDDLFDTIDDDIRVFGDDTDVRGAVRSRLHRLFHEVDTWVKQPDERTLRVLKKILLPEG